MKCKYQWKLTDKHFYGLRKDIVSYYAHLLVSRQCIFEDLWEYDQNCRHIVLKQLQSQNASNNKPGVQGTNFPAASTV